MSAIVFDGQQEGERILCEVRPHVLSLYLAIARMVAVSAVIILAVMIIATVVPAARALLMTAGIAIGVAIIAASLWWNDTVYRKSRTYLTDRRIIRFEAVSPFLLTKRALFWNEALKAKGYAPSLLWRILGIGTVEVSPQMNQHDDVIVSYVASFEDLANYIDKVLFTYKKAPQDVVNLKPFIPKPRWNRG